MFGFAIKLDRVLYLMFKFPSKRFAFSAIFKFSTLMYSSVAEIWVSKFLRLKPETSLKFRDVIAMPAERFFKYKLGISKETSSSAIASGLKVFLVEEASLAV